MQKHVPYLIPEQLEKFDQDGFLAIPGYLTPDEVDSLRAEISNVISTMDPSDYPIFTTNEQERQMAPEYFLTSGDKIVPFMEEKARSLNPDGTGVPFHLRINKIGHALHDQNRVFHDISYDSKVGRISKDLGLEVFVTIFVFSFHSVRILQV